MLPLSPIPVQRTKHPCRDLVTAGILTTNQTVLVQAAMITSQSPVASGDVLRVVQTVHPGSAVLKLASVVDAGLILSRTTAILNHPALGKSLYKPHAPPAIAVRALSPPPHHPVLNARGASGRSWPYSPGRLNHRYSHPRPTTSRT